MKIRLEVIDESNDHKMILKNKDTKVFYHDSQIHDSGEFQELSGLVLKLEKKQRTAISHFYKMAEELLSIK